MSGQGYLKLKPIAMTTTMMEKNVERLVVAFYSNVAQHSQRSGYGCIDRSQLNSTSRGSEGAISKKLCSTAKGSTRARGLFTDVTLNKVISSPAHIVT